MRYFILATFALVMIAAPLAAGKQVNPYKNRLDTAFKDEGGWSNILKSSPKYLTYDPQRHRAIHTTSMWMHYCVKRSAYWLAPVIATLGLLMTYVGIVHNLINMNKTDLIPMYIFKIVFVYFALLMLTPLVSGVNYLAGSMADQIVSDNAFDKLSVLGDLYLLAEQSEELKINAGISTTTDFDNTEQGYWDQFKGWCGDKIDGLKASAKDAALSAIGFPARAMEIGIITVLQKFNKIIKYLYEIGLPIATNLIYVFMPICIVFSLLPYFEDQWKQLVYWYFVVVFVPFTLNMLENFCDAFIGFFFGNFAFSSVRAESVAQLGTGLDQGFILLVGMGLFTVLLIMAIPITTIYFRASFGALFTAVSAATVGAVSGTVASVSAGAQIAKTGTAAGMNLASAAGTASTRTKTFMTKSQSQSFMTRAKSFSQNFNRELAKRPLNRPLSMTGFSGVIRSGKWNDISRAKGDKPK